MSQDREFETYMQGKSGLSKSYADVPQIELPDHLDGAILAEAHRAVRARPESRPRRRWIFPLSMAASLFVAVMIGLQLPYLAKGPAGPQVPKEEPVEVAQQDKATASTSVPPAARAPEAEAPAPQNAPAARAEKPRAAPEPAPQAAAGSDLLDAAPVAAESKAPAAAPAPAAPLAAAQAPAPAIAAKRRKSAVPPEPENKMGISAESRPAGPEGYAGDLSEQAAPGAAPMAAPAAEMKAQPPASLKNEASTTKLSPAEWLARIKRLKQEGKLDEARKELAAFKKHYPDYRVPAAIEVR